MESTQDYLTTALLITLVLFLAYLLYRRLLVILGKNETPTYYVNFRDDFLSVEPGVLRVGIEVPEACPVDLTLSDAQGTVVHTFSDAELEAGMHDFELDTSNLASGRYTCLCVTGNQRAERYFTLD